MHGARRVNINNAVLLSEYEGSYLSINQSQEDQMSRHYLPSLKQLLQAETCKFCEKYRFVR